MMPVIFRNKMKNIITPRTIKVDVKGVLCKITKVDHLMSNLRPSKMALRLKFANASIPRAL